MILAQFFRGPFDGERLVLPTVEPWPRFVIPEFGALTVQYLYLYSGMEDTIALYLYDEDFLDVSRDGAVSG